MNMLQIMDNKVLREFVKHTRGYGKTFSKAYLERVKVWYLSNYPILNLDQCYQLPSYQPIVINSPSDAHMRQ